MKWRELWRGFVPLLLTVSVAQLILQPRLAAIAMDACNQCEEACKKHAEKHEECKACGESCAACAKECKKLAS